MYKKCKLCELEKPIEDFAAEKGNKTDGKRGRCKLCETSVRKGIRVQTRDRLNKRDRDKYRSLSEGDKSKLIAKKSESNQKRFKISAKAREARKRHAKSDRGRYACVRSDANRRGRSYSFELTFEEFSTIINSNCFYCLKPNCRGVDRYNNDVGYVLNNCVPCCQRCNEIKMSYTVEEVFTHISKMKAVMGNVIQGSAKVLAPL